MEFMPISPQEALWVDLYDAGEKLYGRAALHPQLVTGRARHADGWHFNECFPPLEVNGKHLGQIMPMVLMGIPDYPAEDAMTYLISAADARRIGQELIHSADKAEKAMRMRVGRADRVIREAALKAERKKARIAMRCTADGCRKERRFFDADGHGFCKRHADARGLRPHGKV